MFGLILPFHYPHLAWQDFYERVPNVGEWPLPPIPGRTLNEEHDFDDDDCVEISHAELEDQAAQERHSFISGSSANEEEEEVALAGNSDEIWVFMVPSPTAGLW